MTCSIQNTTDEPENKYGPSFTTVAHETIAFHTFRRFVVLQSYPDNPITTYHGRATTKPGVDPKAHTIIYTGAIPPPKLPHEKIYKDPIQVTAKAGTQPFDPLSRVNLGKSYLIEWDSRVIELGQVDGQALRLLRTYREMVREEVSHLE
ncbi:MAG: hypothetical protein Q9195_004222 [Heterodermia aff. obscurata]